MFRVADRDGDQQAHPLVPPGVQCFREYMLT